MTWEDASGFFNSDLGKQLTNLGTQIISNELKLSGSGNKNPAVVHVSQPTVQQAPASGMNMTTMYWIAGGVGVLVVAFLVINRR